MFPSLTEGIWLALTPKVALSTTAMTNKLEDLADLFPKIFPRPTPPNHSDLENMPWGFECGEGWYQLIHDLCTTIVVHCNTTGDQLPVASQVKEKFGGLRFYADGCSKGVDDIISKFEDYSYKVCEVCGDPGSQRGGGWIRTMCDTHFKRFQ